MPGGTYRAEVQFKDGKTEEYLDVQLTNGGVIIWDEADDQAWTWLPAQEVKVVRRRGK